MDKLTAEERLQMLAVHIQESKFPRQSEGAYEHFQIRATKGLHLRINTQLLCMPLDFDKCAQITIGHHATFKAARSNTWQE